jgi:MoaA/NifB/PqqE/SkfB family radical SAM enzyme
MRFAAILARLKGPLQLQGPLRALLFRLRLPVRFPLTLTIEPTNRCNLDCVSCPCQQRPQGNIEVGLFGKLIDESRAHGRRIMITLHKDGEPTLHPRFAELVTIAHRARAARLVTLNSNGTALTRDLARQLVLAGLDEIIVSVDASDPETYARIKGRRLFDAVRANVDGIMEVKRQLRRRNPFVKVQMLGTLHDLSQTVDEFVDYWKPRVDGVKVDHFTTWGGGVDGRLGAVPVPARRWPCQYLWYTMAVNWDGRVSRCVYDWRVDEPLGDASRDSLAAIWNGPPFAALRAAHLAGEYPGVCASCGNWAETDDMGPFLRKTGTAWS